MAGISLKGVYGLAAMYELAHAPHSRPMQIRELSALTGMSHAYLEQILAVLRRAGLLSSIRGASGGYRLARSASEITVLEIIEALEGSVCPVADKSGKSLVLEAFWQQMHVQVTALFSLRLCELDEAFQPYHYAI